MIKHTFRNGVKITPNQLAKQMIWDSIEGAVGCDAFCKMYDEDIALMTQREIDEYEKCLQKQLNRVYKLLGVHKF